MKENATLLFLDRETIPIVRFQTEMLSKFEIKKAVTLKGWGMESIQDIDNRGDVEQIEMYDIVDKFNVGVLVIIKPHRFCNFEEHVLPFIEKNISTIKMIVCSWETYHEEIERLCEKHKIVYRKIGYENYKIDADSMHLLQLRTPIIYVTSLSEMSDKFICQQSLFQYFIKKGYNVELVGTKTYSELLGCRSFPLFMFDNRLSNSQKIVGFNHFLRNIEVTNNPDLIIVGIPGEINGFVNGISEYFDDILYLVSNAARPDVTVVSTLYGEVKNPQILVDTLKYKYGWELENVFVNNMMYESQLSLVYKKKEYIKIDTNIIEDEVLELNRNSNIEFYMYEQLDSMCSKIEEQLLKFGDGSIV